MRKHYVSFLLMFRTSYSLTIVRWAMPKETIPHTAVTYEEDSGEEDNTTNGAGLPLQEKTG